MKLSRSRKALSPVVASIILIAVTVAVSIAVAAWMGALTFNFMATEQGQITNLSFYTGNSTAGMISATFKNTGSNPITINEYWANNQKITTNLNTTLPYTVPGNSEWVFSANMTVVAGNSYDVKLVSGKGNAFPRSGYAPSS
jgi:flagellin-like protein